jgi:hypothetical protein
MAQDAAPVAESVQRPARLEGGTALVGAALLGDPPEAPLSSAGRSLPPHAASMRQQEGPGSAPGPLSLWGRPPFNEFILPPVIPAVLPSGIGWRTAGPAPSLIERKPGIDGTFAALSAHRGHALLVGGERAVAAKAICF